MTLAIKSPLWNIEEPRSLHHDNHVRLDRLNSPDGKNSFLDPSMQYEFQHYQDMEAAQIELFQIINRGTVK